MKKLTATLCVIGSVLVLGACTANEKDMGRGYAADTAGNASVSAERTFRSTQSK